jgi:hypothetical protein
LSDRRQRRGDSGDRLAQSRCGARQSDAESDGIVDQVQDELPKRGEVKMSAMDAVSCTAGMCAAGLWT